MLKTYCAVRRPKRDLTRRQAVPTPISKILGLSFHRSSNLEPSKLTVTETQLKHADYGGTSFAARNAFGSKCIQEYADPAWQIPINWRAEQG